MEKEQANFKIDTETKHKAYEVNKYDYGRRKIRR